MLVLKCFLLFFALCNALLWKRKIVCVPLCRPFYESTARLQSSSNWNGATMSQNELMFKDECILVDEKDNIIGHDSKYNAHRFTIEKPHGLLHRAFSVFLFNEDGKLLLQRRAGGKITFPRVWTNTCCSHQLYGHSPSEVDDEAAIANGSVLGTKAAAIRKLKHELGIDSTLLLPSDLKYLTRLHYSAPCVDELIKPDIYNDRGVKREDGFMHWGESEVDYILFAKLRLEIGGEFSTTSSEDGVTRIWPNPEEVCDVKFVDFDELQRMMIPTSGLQWSPWFRKIADNLLTDWWKDLDITISTDDKVELNKIHRL